MSRRLKCLISVILTYFSNFIEIFIVFTQSVLFQIAEPLAQFKSRQDFPQELLLQLPQKKTKMTGCTNCACSSAASASKKETYSVRQVGSANSLEYRLFMENSAGQVISAFHDIPLYPNPSDKSIVNFFIEIPRWTNAKFEICRKN